MKVGTHLTGNCGLVEFRFTQVDATIHTALILIQTVDAYCNG